MTPASFADPGTQPRLRPDAFLGAQPSLVTLRSATKQTAAANVKLAGVASASGNDTVTFTNGTTAYAVSEADTTPGIAHVWNQSSLTSSATAAVPRPPSTLAVPLREPAGERRRHERSELSGQRQHHWRDQQSEPGSVQHRRRHVAVYPVHRVKLIATSSHVLRGLPDAERSLPLGVFIGLKTQHITLPASDAQPQ